MRYQFTRGAMSRGEALKENIMPVEPGRYRHYKGNFYQVIGTARHSETDELLVVYGEGGLWVRPEAMFKELVSVDGELVPRFRKVED